jgi:hypothetical protein
MKMGMDGTGWDRLGLGTGQKGSLLDGFGCDIGIARAR